jgi:pimeloyl-ACP methyl ester carboxylesterase
MTRTLLAVHGAWSAAWAWKKVRPLLRERGVEILTPTLTGLGERAHLLSPAITLETHVRDILAVVETEDVQGAVLLGHSYGGMVATVVANRLPGRFRGLVYLDAFVPRDGQSLLDLMPPAMAKRMRDRALREGEGWKVPPNDLPADTPDADRDWILARRGPQPLAALSEPARRDPGAPWPPRTYVKCTRIGSVDTFAPFAERARTEAGWSLRNLDATHSPQVTAPEALADLLADLVA